MKKVFITMAAFLVVGFVSAQTDTTGTGRKNTTRTEKSGAAKKGQKATQKNKDSVSGNTTRPADKDRRKNNGTTTPTPSQPNTSPSGGRGTK